jgi:outer membrane protein assembly factor BamB
MGVSKDGWRLAYRFCPIGGTVLALCWLGLFVPLFGQAPVRLPDHPTTALIEEAANKAKAKQWLDAIELYQRILDTHGDDLVPVNSQQLFQARWLVHGHLARLPEEGLNIYRQRVDAQALKLVAEGEKDREGIILQRVVREMFCSRATEEAILALARQAFARGDFDSAEHYWRWLLPPTGEELSFPFPKTTPAAIEARLILLDLFRNDRTRARAHLDDFQKKYAEAKGLLAGKEGKFVDTLNELWKQPAKTRIGQEERPGWPTFAGTSGRSGKLLSSLPYLWPNIPAWKVAIVPPNKPDLKEKRPDPLHPQSLSLFPIIQDGEVLLNDAGKLYSIEAKTGKLTTAAGPLSGGKTILPTTHFERFTLTESAGTVYARMGHTGIGPQENPENSFIAAFSSRKADSQTRDLLWKLSPPKKPESSTFFEGTPAASENRLYASFWRFSVGNATVGVASYRDIDGKSPPTLLWQREVGKGRILGNQESRSTQELLSVADGRVVVATNSGSVVALDQENGLPLWEFRYARHEQPGATRVRDLCPPLVDGGRIYIAPLDTDRLFCLDAFSGRLIWDREGVEVVHLLGVARGRLIATFAGAVRGIRGLNAWTGADSGENGWTIHDDGGEVTFGRGLVNDDVVLWPTRHALHFLNPRDGTPLRASIPGPFGNLTYADGFLIVTTGSEVWGFIAEGNKLSERRTRATSEPRNEQAQAAYAFSLIDRGQIQEALPLLEKTGQQQTRLTWLVAEQARQKGNTDLARQTYERLTERPSDFTASALVRLAEMEPNQDKQVEAWRKVRMEGEWIRDRMGNVWPAHCYAEENSPAPLVMRPAWHRENNWRRDLDAKPLLPSGAIWQISSEGDLNETELAHYKATKLFLQKNRLWKLNLGQPILLLDFTTQAPAIDAIPLVEEIVPFPPVSILPKPDQTIEVASGGRSHYWFFAPPLIETVPASHTSSAYPLAGEGGFYRLLQLRSGRIIAYHYDDKDHREYPCTPKPWPEPPLHLSKGEFLLAEDGRVVRFDFEEGNAITSYTLTDSPTLSGSLPRLRRGKENVAVVIERNIGFEVDLIDHQTLHRLWDHPPLPLGRVFHDLQELEGNWIAAVDDRLISFDQAGEIRWEVPLPSVIGSWKMTTAIKTLALYPSEAIPARSFDIETALRDSGLNRNRLQKAFANYYDVQKDRELPVLLFDPKSGELLQRFLFPVHDATPSVQENFGKLTVIAGTQYWILSPSLAENN